MVESKIWASPSMSVGTSRRGLADWKAASGMPVAIAWGRMGVNGIFFSRRAMRIFCA